ncbi:OsmC family protein [Pseudochelatococcus sp. B33]
MSSGISVEQVKPKQVEIRSTDVHGRYIVDVGHAVFVADSTAGKNPAFDGTAKAPLPSYLLLAALGVSAFGLIEKRARELGVTLIGGRIGGTVRRDDEDCTRYSSIKLDISFDRIDGEFSNEIVDAFAKTCPIYNTIARVVDISTSVTVGGKELCYTSGLSD